MVGQRPEHEWFFSVRMPDLALLPSSGMLPLVSHKPLSMLGSLQEGTRGCHQRHFLLAPNWRRAECHPSCPPPSVILSRESVFGSQRDGFWNRNGWFESPLSEEEGLEARKKSTAFHGFRVLLGRDYYLTFVTSRAEEGMLRK